MSFCNNDKIIRFLNESHVFLFSFNSAKAPMILWCSSETHSSHFNQAVFPKRGGAPDRDPRISAESSLLGSSRGKKLVAFEMIMGLT